METMEYEFPLTEFVEFLAGKRHKRAGYTTNKRRGLSKSKRRMAKASRARNRRK